MKIIEFSPNLAQPIKMFESVSVKSVHLGDGSGEVHVYCIYFESGSEQPRTKIMIVLFRYHVGDGAFVQSIQIVN